MLHTEAVNPPTLELLKSLQKKEYLKGFNLVGGTALALYYNHRISVDIDLFSNFDFDTGQLLENLQKDGDSVKPYLAGVLYRIVWKIVF